MKCTTYKDVKLAVIFGVILALLLSAVRLDANCATIRQSVLRLHVLANSDSEADQTLKLAVRDELLTYADKLFSHCADEAAVLQMATEELEVLQTVAQNKVYQCGYTYPVQVSVGKAYFDTRVYEDFSLPAGEYDALRVVIGAGEGKNWWCVLFPPVCLPSAQVAIGEHLSAENARLVEGDDRPKYKIAFKTVEIFENIKQFLKKFSNT